MFIHFGLTRLVVGDINEVLELLKLHFPKGSNVEKLGGKVVLHIVMLRGPTKNK